MLQTFRLRVRFAPSPTGNLHIGGVRTALFNYVFARQKRGSFLIRIEDTDLQRSTKEYLTSQQKSLEWLCLESDEPFVFQHSRIEEHKKYAKQLLDDGLAYRCYCPFVQAEEVIERLDQGIGQLYDGRCRDKEPREDGTPFALRFRVPDDSEEINCSDLIRGEVSIKKDALDDFIIVRQDGTPVYNFCVVIDDIFMKISHVIRGEDHLSNTFKQILLYKALRAPLPIFAHLPLILGESGGKLSKRDAAVSVDHYREMGIMPEALCNYLVRLGWSYGDQEIFSREEMIEHFSFDHVGKKGAMFDMKKLLWLNGVYLRQSSGQELMYALDAIDEKYLCTLKQYWSDKQLQDLFDLYKQRATTLVELYEGIKALAAGPQQYDFELIEKWRTSSTGAMLHDFAQRIAHSQGSEHAQLMAIAKEVVGKYEMKLVAIAQPIRFALTGGIQSPGVFELIAIMGNQESVKRITMLAKALSE